MNEIKKQILEALNFRHACKEFNSDKKIADEDFNLILEAAHLSPSSFGLEPWKFIILQNQKLRAKILPVCWGAQKQLPTASHFVIILARKAVDMKAGSEYLKRFMNEVQHSSQETIEKRMTRLHEFQEKDFKLKNDDALFDWACKQTYIVLANMITVASFISIDSCPIEGFNREQLEKILSSEKILDNKHFGVSCMVAFGYRKNESSPKTRQTMDKITEWIK